MRARKPKNIDQKLQIYRSWIVDDPRSLKGCWSQSRNMSGARVKLDIGCGKGSFAIGTAQLDRDSLIVGIDTEPICIAMAARHAHDAGVDNAAFAIAAAEELPDAFAPGELDTIYLNFSTPMPKAKCADRRLTYADNLLRYRGLLAPDGRILMKTDSRPLFEWSLGQFDLAGYEVRWQTADAHADGLAGVTSDVERKLLGKGAKVSALEAVPDGRPASAIAPNGHIEQNGPMSLVDFLPDDLESMTYVPYGMESTVENMINRRKNAVRREAIAAAKARKQEQDTQAPQI